MPILSISFGSSRVCFLYVESPKNYKVYFYPYVYSPILFSHFVDEATFYKELLKRVCTELKISYLECDILVTGFPEVPNLSIPNIKINLTLEKAFSSISEYSCFYVGNFKVIHSNSFVFACPLEDYLNQGNIICTLSIFSQIVPINDLDNFAVDNIPRFYLINSMSFNEHSKPVLFTGHSFSAGSKSKYLSYLLAVDSIRDTGFYQLKVDNENVFSCLALLSVYKPEVYESVVEKFGVTTLGFLLNSPGNTECLFESDAGTKQLIDIKGDDLFFFPLDESTRARVVIKNNTLGTVEKVISGGTLGFVIDTRNKKDSKIFTPYYVNKNYNVWTKKIKDCLEGF